MNMTPTIDWRDGAIVIVDQTRLPDELVMLSLTTVDDLVIAIRRLAVRGAMALGVAGALGVALAARNAAAAGEPVDERVREAAAKLIAARPTAVNLGWGVRRVVAAASGGAQGMLAAALAVRDEDVIANTAIAERGADLLAGRARILTHCNAGALAAVAVGTALAVIGALRERGGVELVYACETRPLLQGARLTTWELARMGIPHRLIVDGAAAGLIVGGRVDAVVVGADRIAANGDVANKVGTLAHALAARRAGIPFVVAAPESTFDPDTATGNEIRIEERDEREVLEFRGLRASGPGTRALNPAFDVTPADLVTAIVTERRTVRPSTAVGMAPAIS
ncbi:MAG TPA: S-methyl-5-thioribose-1-phosphate isomerase [Candidatus Acidoferrales bacterium]|nr:S-methyl-5-thioribose-1-phosphate isomerase [Candidatus Acidoferrales bacterium]